jgi:hypothetical protein
MRNIYWIGLIAVVSSCSGSEQRAGFGDTAAAVAEDTADNEPFEGSTDRVQSDPGRAIATQTDVRVARHDGFERIVFEFRDSLPGYVIEYASDQPMQCGSGDPVSVEGSAVLRVRFTPGVAHEMIGENARVTVTRREWKPGLAVVREMKLTCDFEAELEWVLGLSEKAPFRVITLLDPARVVLDLGASAGNR